MRVACLLISGLMVALAGCGGKSGDSYSQPAPTGPVLLSFQRTGGVAASFETLTLREDGSAVVTEGYGGAVIARFRVTHGQLAQLQRQADGAQLESIGSAPESGCADCYAYVVTYRGTTVRRDEGNLPASMKPLVASLEAIVTAHD